MRILIPMLLLSTAALAGGDKKVPDYCVNCPTTAVVTVEVPCDLVLAPRRGFWFVPVSLAWMGGTSTTASWEQNVDPSIRVEQDASLGVGAGIGRQWPNRWAGAVQLFRFDSESSAAWVDRAPYSSDLETTGGGGRWAAVFTVNVPLGKR